MSEALRLLLELNAALTFAVLVVLTARIVFRRTFGPRAAYGIWSAVPLALIAVCLPRVGPDAFVGDSPGADMLERTLLGGWAVGVIIAAGLMAAAQVRFGDLARRGLAGPAVTGVIVPRLVMPADSATRWRPEEKTLILAHEHAHLERGDLRVNSVVALLQCLFWCNPLAHVAATRFRFDQELACDATVMAMQVGRRRLYAEALLKADSGVGAPFSCSWGDVGRGALETRVTSLRLPHHAPSPTAVLTATGLALAIAGAAWAVQPASPEQTQDPRPRILNLRLLPPQASPQPVRTAETA
ncbi:MAG: M56 family metallopeptidase [Brevundimonas sp.]|jgi:beta-lactamase regulating signal transducer with metallopeptidase domain